MQLDGLAFNALITFGRGDVCAQLPAEIRQIAAEVDTPDASLLIRNA